MFAFRWFSLAPELRLMILEILARENRGLASYAQVCKEWQEIMEKRNFHRLKLQVPCLDDLENMVTSRHMVLVKHIWLNIELQPYTCRSCQSTESSSWHSGNNSIIRQAVLKLFSILSTWNAGEEGLTLELSAQSPSDSKHWFKNHHFGSDDEEPAGKLDDPKHRWIGNQQAAVPGELAVLRLFETVELKLELPEVYAVSSFIIRRQCHRQFTPGALCLLFSKLPRLETVMYEPWQAWYSFFAPEMRDQQYESLIKEHLPRLKRVTVFEDFNEDFDTLLQGALAFDTARVPSPTVSTALAHRSLNLEHLSVSFMVDAQYFFQACRSQWTWECLQSLALTSRSLTHTADCKVVSNLLQDAGAAATHMPKLRIMALWSGAKGEACGFIYRKKSDSAVITLRSTWDIKLEPRVVHAWERVASRLRIRKQPLSGSAIRSHGDAIQQLGLPREVIDPVSLWQIRKEHS